MGKTESSGSSVVIRRIRCSRPEPRSLASQPLLDRGLQ